jgi:hypothetical protein
MDKESGEKIKANLIKELKDEIEEERKQIEKISEILKHAIQSNLKIELIISNPPTDMLSKAITSPDRIENGYLWTTTEKGSKIAIELSRIKRVRIVGGYEF